MNSYLDLQDMNLCRVHALASWPHPTFPFRMVDISEPTPATTLHLQRPCVYTWYMCTCHNLSNSWMHLRSYKRMPAIIEWHWGWNAIHLTLIYQRTKILQPSTTDKNLTTLQPMIYHLLPNFGGPLHIAQAAYKPPSTLKPQLTSTHTNLHLFSKEEGWIIPAV